LVAVHHIDAHISANYLEHYELAPPFLCLVVSGGHTQIVFCSDYGKYELIGQTLDDAAGEAFDKAARVLGLPYPGGPALDRLAQNGNPSAVKLPRAKTANPYDFSFSGLKTAFIQLKRKGSLDGVSGEDAAASFREAVCDALVSKTIAAANAMNIDRLPVCIAGGVAANTRLRAMLSDSCNQVGFPLFIPSIKLCTDNAAMVASAGYYNFISGKTSGLTLNAVPYLPL
jgi:N6-L-threonylcarbamoyladenine synthase